MDLKIGADGNIVLTKDGFRLVKDRPLLVAQRLAVRLRTYLGEWFLDTTMGVDWFADVLLKNVSKQTVDNILQGEIKKDMFVVNITSFKSVIINRNYECTFTVEIANLDHEVEIRYLANENNLIVTDELGNYLTIEV